MDKIITQMIYLDYAAATPVSSAALEAMTSYFHEDFFNPSAPYQAAKKIKLDYQSAKQKLAQSIGAKASDIIITSGATESNNLALGVLKNFAKSDSSDLPEILILATEHPSVSKSALNSGFKVQFIKVQPDGLIDLADFKAKLSPHTIFVSVALVNNEIGAIQPLAKLAELIRQERKSRLIASNLLPLYFHTDASQAPNLLDLNVARLGVDLLTLSSAKVYGPKGVGLLYFSRDLKLSPIILGGGQELGLRSGTENVPGVIGFATALSAAQSKINSHRRQVEQLSQLFRQEILNSPIKPLFLGSTKHQLSSFCPLSFPGLDAERLIYKLEAKEIYLSTGSACAASKGQISVTLSSIGLSPEEIAGSLRITFGAPTTKEEVKAAAHAIIQAVQEELKRINS